MMINEYPQEYVLTIPTQEFERIGYFSGLCFEVERYRELLENDAYHQYIERNKAEHDPSFKQLIPYALIRCGASIFVYRRGKLQGEKRLVGNYSCGIGGHISIDDPSLFGTTYEEGLRREVGEEVDIQSPYRQNIAALINDDSDEVGKVHLGIVHILTVEEPKVVAREKALAEPHFMSFELLQAHRDEFENWSQICIDNLATLVAKQTDNFGSKGK